MSGGDATGRARNAAPVNVGVGEVLPIDPADGGVQVHVVGGVPIPVSAVNTETIYETAGAGENFSIIPAAADPASVSAVYARLLASAAAARWIQIHKGQVKPIAGAKPFLVGDELTPIGGNTQWTPPDEVERDPGKSNGYVVVLSTTQDTYTDVALPELTTVALGRP